MIQNQYTLTNIDKEMEGSGALYLRHVDDLSIKDSHFI